MGRLRAKSDYETLRSARISENKARMLSLGLERSAGELRSITSSTTRRRARKARLNESTPRRRSARLSAKPSDSSASVPQAKEASLDPVRDGLHSRRCESQGRGAVYDPVLGICCHFCRQKKLCGEEDCMRCGNREINQPCIGKTQCSICHSSNGVLCRACLKVRYGEELDEVRKKKDWMCPHCVEEKGINPFWICNSSLCLKKRKMVPTGIAIYQAREEGYKSVAHMLMEKLKCDACLHEDNVLKFQLRSDIAIQN